MLGRKDFTKNELATARTAIEGQLAAYRRLAEAVEGSGDADAVAALEAFEPRFFTNLTLALDRPFVHRVRMVTGKDGTPLNELEMYVDALTTKGGILKQSTVIKLDPATSVVRIGFGSRVELTAEQFEDLAKAVFAELEQKFVTG